MSLQEKIRTTFYSLIDLLDASDDKELHFKSSPDSWNMLECTEHVCLVNRNVARILETPPPPSYDNKQSELYSEGKLNHLLVTKRDVKRKSPDPVTPKGIFENAEEAKDMIYTDVERILNTLDQEDITSQTHTVSHHALGEMTKTDWLHFMLAHTQRHLMQMEEIKKEYKKQES
jgi:hypothetical protein